MSLLLLTPGLAACVCSQDFSVLLGSSPGCSPLTPLAPPLAPPKLWDPILALSPRPSSPPARSFFSCVSRLSPGLLVTMPRQTPWGGGGVKPRLVPPTLYQGQCEGLYKVYSPAMDCHPLPQESPRPLVGRAHSLRKDKGPGHTISFRGCKLLAAQG